MRSMTGFGQAAGENSRHAVTVTLKGVNSRYLELKVRLADEYRSSEPELRDLLGRELSRGRVEATMEITPLEEREANVEVHRKVVQAAHGALHELVGEGLITQELTAGDLLRLPEAFSVHVAPDRWDEADRELLSRLTESALEQLVAARTLEGQKLEGALRERLGQLEALAERLAAMRPQALERMRQGVEGRLERLLDEHDLELDRARLAQEVALLAEKSDVAEELDRLASHLEHFTELLGRRGPVGKRLDFLMQEIFRELNTLGAKCRSSDMTRVVLDAKEISEQLREQLQNVE